MMYNRKKKIGQKVATRRELRMPACAFVLRLVERRSFTPLQVVAIICFLLLGQTLLTSIPNNMRSTVHSFDNLPNFHQEPQQHQLPQQLPQLYYSDSGSNMNTTVAEPSLRRPQPIKNTSATRFQH